MQCSRLPNRNGVTLSDSSHQPLLARSLLLPYLGSLCVQRVLRQARVVAAAAAAVTSGHYTDNKAPRYTRLQSSHVSMGITEP